jgi:hypothetical protein
MTAAPIGAMVPGHRQHERAVMLPRRRSLTLPTCSICLRVLRQGNWVDAETAIVEHRSYERESPPSLKPALCTDCEEAIYHRRYQPAA